MKYPIQRFIPLDFDWKQSRTQSCLLMSPEVLEVLSQAATALRFTIIGGEMQL